jgi:hypothetical protein
MEGILIESDPVMMKLFKHRMPERLSKYKKYHIAGTKIYDNILLGA